MTGVQTCALPISLAGLGGSGDHGQVLARQHQGDGLPGVLQDPPPGRHRLVGVSGEAQAGYSMPDYKRRLDKFYSSLLTGDALRRITSQRQADAYEERAGRTLGPCILKYLERKYPEVNKDPTLREAIDYALTETESDIGAAVVARKIHLLSKDSDSVRRIGWAIRKKIQLYILVYNVFHCIT